MERCVYKSGKAKSGSQHPETRKEARTYSFENCERILFCFKLSNLQPFVTYSASTKPWLVSGTART